MISNPADQSVEPDNYAPHWLVLILLIAFGIGAYHWHTIHSQPAPPYETPAITAPGVNWFLVLRLPAITAQYESGIGTMRTRYGQWLDALTRAGFHPMKLSEVIDRLNRGVGVPDKSVVLSFDPGFRRTYQLVAPTLAQHQFPAVWFSNETAMRHGHREYVTYHAADAMIRSGWWDVGFTQPDGTIRLKTRDHGTLMIGNAQGSPAWSPATGGMALNRGQTAGSLKRLNVMSDWTGQDLLHRVQAEVPVQRATYLTEGPVQNLMWGLTTEDAASPSTTMNLQVLPYKRGLVLDWFGTKGLEQFTVNAQATALVGEFCMRLRWDEAHGDGITVLVSPDQWAVLEIASFHLKRKWIYSRSGEGGGFHAALRLQNNQLSVAMDHETPMLLPLTSPTAPGEGLFQLFLVDKFRGTARADGVRMCFTPL